MRLIDADELKKHKGNYNPVKYSFEYGDVITVDDIDSAPTIDAVIMTTEVVRCKDCKLLSHDRIAPDWNRICTLYGVGKANNGYCDECVRKDPVR